MAEISLKNKYAPLILLDLTGVTEEFVYETSEMKFFR